MEHSDSVVFGLRSSASPPNERVIDLAIVAETRLYREGLARALDADSRFHVVGTAADLASAMQVIRECRGQVEVALLDHAVAEGCSAIEALHSVAPHLRVVAVAIREEENDVLPWVEAGAVGFVPHHVALDELKATLAIVTEGCGLCSPRITGFLLDHVAATAHLRHAADLRDLTQREREIAVLINDGLSNKEIGVQLGIKLPTVKNHVHSILEKLDVHRRAEAAVAVRAGNPLRTRAGIRTS